MTKSKVVESKRYKNFIAVPLGHDYIDYGTVVFDTFEEAKAKAEELSKEKYPEMWGD